jgi:hypothetical protein
MTAIDRRAAQYVDLRTPVIPSDLPARDRMRYIQVVTNLLSGPAFPERELRCDQSSELIRIKTLGGEYVYPAFQFDEDGRLNRLIPVSALFLGYGFARMEWWITPNENLDGQTPASLLKVDEEQDRLFAVIKSLPPREHPHG